MTIMGSDTADLWQACLAGDVKAVDAAVAGGADPMVRDRNGETCLHMAARSGEVKVIDRLVRAGFDVDLANHNGQTPLHIAVNKDHKDVIVFLINNGASTDLTTNFTCMTPLHMACRDNNHHMAKSLLDLGANCAITDKINKWPDFYTSSEKVLDVFDKHFPVCTHGRAPVKGQEGKQSRTSQQIKPTTNSKNSPSPVESKTGNPVQEETDLSKTGKAVQKEKDTPAVSGYNSQHQGRGIYDQMEHYTAEGGMDSADLNRGDANGIYDKMENYDQERAERERLEREAREAKKLKVNHKIDFSDDHKKKMRLSVWDRLLTQPKPEAKEAKEDGNVKAGVTNVGKARAITKLVNAKADGRTWQARGANK